MPKLRVTRDNWWQIVEAARKHAGKPNLPAYACLFHYYNVCLVSLVDVLSMKLWNLYQRIDGTKNETYESYSRLPAFWGDACAIIDTEIGRIDRQRASEERQRQAEAIKRVSSK